MLIRPILLAGSMALLAACLQSNTPDRPAQDTPPIKSEHSLLRDPDGNPVLEVPVDILQDVRKQMQAKGLDQQIQELEAAYDFKTGKARVSAPAAGK
jgi:hypothetical protein